MTRSKPLSFLLLATLGLSTAGAAEDGLRIVWKKKIGSGYSGVAVGGGRAVTMYSDGESDVGLGGEGTAVGGFDPATGEKRWTSGTDIVMYQSPVPVTFGGRRQVVTAGNQLLFGLDPKSGEILWQWPHGGSGGRGAVSLIPVPVGDRRLFLALSEESSKTIEVGGPASGFAVEVAWEARSIRNSYANPVPYRGHLYGFSSRIFACADAATGELKWRSRPPGDGFLTLADSFGLRGPPR